MRGASVAMPSSFSNRPSTRDVRPSSSIATEAITSGGSGSDSTREASCSRNASPNEPPSTTRSRRSIPGSARCEQRCTGTGGCCASSRRSRHSTGSERGSARTAACHDAVASAPSAARCRVGGHAAPDVSAHSATVPPRSVTAGAMPTAISGAPAACTDQHHGPSAMAGGSRARPAASRPCARTAAVSQPHHLPARAPPPRARIRFRDALQALVVHVDVGRPAETDGAPGLVDRAQAPPSAPAPRRPRAAARGCLPRRRDPSTAPARRGRATRRRGRSASAGDRGARRCRAPGRSRSARSASAGRR